MEEPLGFDGEVSRAGGHVQHSLRTVVVEQPDGLRAPPLVDAQAQDAVEQIVARGDGIEHLLDALGLAISLTDRGVVFHCRLSICAFRM
jgi:hypothetical protein